MTIEKKVREIVRTAVDNSLSVDKTTQAILALIKPMSGILQADEVTLAFFRKSLEMPDGTLEDLCREIIRLRAIKPISREDILKAIKRVRWTRAAKAFEDTNSRFEYDLADSLLELINGKEA